VRSAKLPSTSPVPSPLSLQVEKELETICRELLDVLEKHLLPEDKTAEGQVFYWKMAGDYWRYLSEFSGGECRRGAGGWGGEELWITVVARRR